MGKRKKRKKKRRRKRESKRGRGKKRERKRKEGRNITPSNLFFNVSLNLDAKESEAFYFFFLS